MRNVLRAAAVGLLALAVVVVGPGSPVAEAAYSGTTYGEEVSVIFDEYEPWSLSGFGCELVGYGASTYTTDEPTSAQVKGSVACDTGKLQADVYVQTIVFDATYAADGLPGITDGCSYVATPAKNIDSSTTRNFTFTAGADQTSAFQSKCAPIVGDGSVGTIRPVHEVCFLMREGGGSTYEVCRPFSLDFPGAGEQDSPDGTTGTSGCGRGRLIKPHVIGPHAVSVSGGWAWRMTVTMRIGSKTALGSVLVGGQALRLYGYIKTSALGTTISPSAATGTTAGQAPLFQFPMETVDTVTYTVTGPTKTGAVGSVSEAIGLGFVGAGYYGGPANAMVNSSSADGFNRLTSSSGLDGTWLMGNTSRAPELSGHTIPAWCYGYWGTVWDTVASTDAMGQTAPITPLVPLAEGTEPPPYVEPPSTTEPEVEPPTAPPPLTPDDDTDDDDDGVPDDDGCGAGFSIWNPLSWASVGICGVIAAVMAAVKVLGQIVDAIVSLAATIAEAIVDALMGILDALAALFIPDPDVLSDALAGLRDAFDTGPIGDWTGSLTGAFSGGTAGSCEGPAIDLSQIGVPDAPTMEPFKACDGATADAAGIVRMVVTVTVGLSGGLFIARMVTSGLGINVPTPGGRKDQGA